MNKFAFAVAASLVFWCAGIAMATPTPQQKCNKTRVAAWYKYVSCMNAFAAAVAEKPDPYPPIYARAARCRHKFFKKWSNFQNKASFVGTTCAAARFTDNGATVSDRWTGLEWEKKDSNDNATNLSNPHDTDNTYHYSDVHRNFLAGADGTPGLTKTCFAGQCDWRLPTMWELQTLVLDFACTGTGLGPKCNCSVAPCSVVAVGPLISQALYASSTHDASYPLPGSGSINLWFLVFGGGVTLGNGAPYVAGEYDGLSAIGVRGGL